MGEVCATTEPSASVEVPSSSAPQPASMMDLGQEDDFVSELGIDQIPFWHFSDGCTADFRAPWSVNQLYNNQKINIHNDLANPCSELPEQRSDAEILMVDLTHLNLDDVLSLASELGMGEVWAVEAPRKCNAAAAEDQRSFL